MKKRLLILPVLATVLFLHIGLALSASDPNQFALKATIPTPVLKSGQTEKQAQIYGVQLMTEQERNEYRARMLAAITSEERELIRNENHKAMQERATSHGMSLPEKHPADVGDMNQGAAMMGQGHGMGQGGAMKAGGGGMKSGGGHVQ